MARLIDACFQPGDARISHGAALALLRDRLAPIAGSERVGLAAAGGRILAEDVIAPRPIPAHTNAAVDGYAFAFAAYDAANGSLLPLAARIAAGSAVAGPIPPGSVARIFTGATVPARCDTIAMQEDVTEQVVGGQTLAAIPPGLKPGANRRLAGEDVAQGAVVAAAGQRLRPQDLAAIASTGAADVLCYQRLRVGVVSTGDEIIPPGSPLGPGQVYDANAAMLAHLVALTGAEPITLGHWPDDAAIVRAALSEAASRCDVIISSGGASRGEEDHVVVEAARLGTLYNWQIAIKPGRPMAMGQIGDCVFMGLPGNPVAAFVCFLIYVRPAILRLSGAPWSEPVRYPIPAAFSLKKKAGRREFWRGWLEAAPDGRLMAQKFPSDGSGLITGLTRADGLIEVGEDVTAIAEGEAVHFIPFAAFGFGRD